MLETNINITPPEKLNSLFLILYELQMQVGVGQLINIFNIVIVYNSWKDWGFKNQDECIYYLTVLDKSGLIEIKGNLESCFLTFDGLIKANELQEEGKNSTNCFIAMSFDAEEDVIYKEAIAPACQETGFKPIRVDQQHLHSEQTINDGIIACIKQSRFMIADFTKQKDGVYFEAGYALGRGLKVIYSCRRDHFKDSHFDTNHFPHIIYDNPEELRARLIDKIEAWIKD